MNRETIGDDSKKNVRSFPNGSITMRGYLYLSVELDIDRKINFG
jgi:hypothetical protein